MFNVALGRTDEQVSALALGTMYFNTTVGKEMSMKLMDQYVEAGGTFIDTANMYSSWLPGFVGGESENLIGEWMQTRKIRSKLFLSTKVGLPMQDVPQSLKGALILRECENSLKRLQIDTIDLYFIHREDPDTPIEETMQALDRLVRSGKVRYVGVSNHIVWRIAEARCASKVNHWPELCCAQYRYSYLRPRHGTTFYPQMHATEDLLDYIRSTSMAFMAYATLLSGAYADPQKQIPEQYLGGDSSARLETIRNVANEVGSSVHQVVLAWLMQQEPRAIPIITAENQGQLLENLGALDVRLSEEQLKRMDEASDKP